MKILGAVAGLALLLSACVATQSDVRAEHVLACETYTSALERAVVWKEAGLMDEDAVAVLQEVEASTTPLCMGAEPTLEGATLVQAATSRLELLLLQFTMD